MSQASPIELDILQTKKEIVESINNIGSLHNLPSVMVIMILEQIISDSKINMLENALTKQNITEDPENTEAVE